MLKKIFIEKIQPRVPAMMLPLDYSSPFDDMRLPRNVAEEIKEDRQAMLPLLLPKSKEGMKQKCQECTETGTFRSDLRLYACDYCVIHLRSRKKVNETEKREEKTQGHIYTGRE